MCARACELCGCAVRAQRCEPVSCVASARELKREAALKAACASMRCMACNRECNLFLYIEPSHNRRNANGDQTHGKSARRRQGAGGRAPRPLKAASHRGPCGLPPPYTRSSLSQPYYRVKLKRRRAGDLDSAFWCAFLPNTCWPHRPSSALGPADADGLVEEMIPRRQTCSDF